MLRQLPFHLSSDPSKRYAKTRIIVPEQSKETILGDLIGIVIAGRWISVGVIALCLLFAVLVAFLTQPVYKADVLMVPVGNETAGENLQSITSQLGGLAAIGGFNIPSNSDPTDEAIAILKSRSFTQDFFAENQLLPVLFADKWDEEGSKWKTANTDRIPTMNDAYELFDTEIRRVSQNDDTGLVTLSILWTEPQVAADWANQLVTRLNEHMRRRAANEARKTMAFLETELGNTNVVEVQQGIYRLIENELKKLMITNVRDEYAFKVIDPAVAPEADDFAKPRRAMIVSLGLVAGFFLAILLPLLAALAPVYWKSVQT